MHTRLAGFTAVSVLGLGTDLALAWALQALLGLPWWLALPVAFAIAAGQNALLLTGQVYRQKPSWRNTGGLLLGQGLALALRLGVAGAAAYVGLNTANVLVLGAAVGASFVFNFAWAQWQLGGATWKNLWGTLLGLLQHPTPRFYGSVMIFAALFCALGFGNLSLPSWRVQADAYSDRFVMDALFQHSPAHGGPWLGTMTSLETLYTLPRELDDYGTAAAAHSASYQPYLSQTGLQAMVLWPLYELITTLLPSPRGIALAWIALQLQSALLAALMITLIAGWLRVHLGTKGTLLALGAFAVTQPWPAFFAPTLYWQLWAYLAPMAVVAWGVGMHKSPLPWWRWGLTACGLGMAVFMKCSMGYEFVSVILVMAMLPALLAVWLAIHAAPAAQRARQLWAGLWRLSLLGVAALLGFIGAICWHLQLLATLQGGWAEGIQTFLGVVGKRVAWVPAGAAPLAEVYAQSLQVGLPQVLLAYLLKPFQTLPQIVWLALFAWAGWQLWRPRGAHSPQAQGWVLLWGVATLGSFSWLVLATGHSVNHMHLVPIVWALPCNLMGLVLLAKLAQRRWPVLR